MFKRGSVSVILRACSFLGIWVPGGHNQGSLGGGCFCPRGPRAGGDSRLPQGPWSEAFSDGEDLDRAQGSHLINSRLV